MYALRVQGSCLDQILAKKLYMRYTFYFCFTTGKIEFSRITLMCLSHAQ